MPGGYRITVRGVMSDRFCQAFRGLSRRVAGDRTVLEGDGGGAPPMDEVLTTLDNLGLEVVALEHPHATAAQPTVED